MGWRGSKPAKGGQAASSNGMEARRVGMAATAAFVMVLSALLRDGDLSIVSSGRVNACSSAPGSCGALVPSPTV